MLNVLLKILKDVWKNLLTTKGLLFDFPVVIFNPSSNQLPLLISLKENTAVRMHLISLEKKERYSNTGRTKSKGSNFSRFEFANSLAGTTASRVDICMCTYLCGGRRINRKDALIKVDK